MSQAMDIESALGDPRLLEELYHKARQAGTVVDFVAAIRQRYAATPDNLLLAAWYYRLQSEEAAAPLQRDMVRRINWPLAVPLGIILGLIYWILSDQKMVTPDGMPYVLILWAPLAAAALITLVTLGGPAGKPLWRSALVALLVLALAIYAVWIGGQARADYRVLSPIHLPLLAWAAVGLVVAGWGSDDRNRFAFLIKSTEAIVTGGIYGGAAGLFLAVTFGIFQAIGVIFPDALMRLLTALAAGLVPLLAVATVYDARFSPIEQRFDEGLGKLIFTMGRFFLPLTLIVGVIYVLTIPFNFWKPFAERDVLIVYNAMLFAVMALLVFATPITGEGLSSSVQVWLRRGMLVVAILAILVSLYALSAALYRTATGGGITINRLTIIGWNVINIGILVDLVTRQRRAGQAAWLSAQWRTARYGMIAYTVWAGFVLVVMPWLFPA